MITTIFMFLVSVACVYWGLSAENYFLVGAGGSIAVLAIAGHFRSNGGDDEDEKSLN